jgi:hypothetical protein
MAEREAELLAVFDVQADDDLNSLAAFALGILHQIFGQVPEADISVNIPLAEEK